MNLNELFYLIFIYDDINKNNDLYSCPLLGLLIYSSYQQTLGISF